MQRPIEAIQEGFIGDLLVGDDHQAVGRKCQGLPCRLKQLIGFDVIHAVVVDFFSRHIKTEGSGNKLSR